MLHTESLVLRPYRADDLAAIHDYAGDPENLVHLLWGPNSEAETREFLDRVLANEHAHPRTEFDFAVERKEDGRLIGGCGIALVGHREAAEVGWVLHRDFHRRGYGTEACHELLRFGFETLGVHRIFATCRADNVASFRVMEKNGMRREAHFHHNRPGRPGDPERWYDELEYAMLETEWKGRKRLEP